MKKITILLFCLLPLFFLSQDIADATVFVCPPCNSSCDKLEFEKEGTCQHCGMQLIKKSERDKIKTQKKLKIAFYLQSGVEVLDFAGPMEVFAYAGFEVFTVSKTKEPIISQGILTVLPDYSIADAPDADILAFFGGNAKVAFEDKKVIDWVRKQEVDYHFSVCTGAFVLGEAGILEGQTATTFHNALDGLEKSYPKTKVLKNARYVDNGKVITTAGISAGIDGALHLVAKLNGFNAARKIAYHMEYDKWTPGDGIILSEDNPYHVIHDTEHLNDYVGKYEFKNGMTIQLKINASEKSLYAKVGERNYPLFYLEKNQFSNVGDDKVSFLRSEDGKVTGYKNSEDEKSFFRKLD